MNLPSRIRARLSERGIAVLAVCGFAGSGKDYLADQLGFTRLSFAKPLYEEVQKAFGVDNEYLANRATKESPREMLTLARCQDSQFVDVFWTDVLKLKMKLLKAVRGRSDSSISNRRIKKAQQILDQARSPRQIMQIWGTEYRRKSRFGLDTYWTDKVVAEISSNLDKAPYVITDMRFKNEDDVLSQFNALKVRIHRQSVADKVDVSKLHASERDLLNMGYPTLLNVEGNPTALLEDLDALLVSMDIPRAIAA